MTSMQWLFEYISLKEKEKENLKLVNESFKAYKNMMISLLGLNILGGETSKSDTESDEDSFTPLSIITGRREVIELALKKYEEEHVDVNNVEDEEFDKLSQAIARGEDLGDMSPLFDIDEKIESTLTNWFNPTRNMELERLGIEVKDVSDKPTIHVNVDVEEIKRKQNEQKTIDKITNEDLLKQLNLEAEQERKKGALVTFDDND